MIKVFVKICLLIVTEAYCVKQYISIWLKLLMILKEKQHFKNNLCYLELAESKRFITQGICYCV